VLLGASIFRHVRRSAEVGGENGSADKKGRLEDQGKLGETGRQDL